MAIPYSIHSGLKRLGPMEGKSEADFEKALGSPTSVSTMPDGTRLLQWRSGTLDIKWLAVLFDAHHRFMQVTHRYQVDTAPFEAPPGAIPPPSRSAQFSEILPTRSSELARLAALHREGILTTDEFAEMKRQIVDGRAPVEFGPSLGAQRDRGLRIVRCPSCNKKNRVARQGNHTCGSCRQGFKVTFD